YGNPFERDPQAVLEDVRDGFVSSKAAERDYGVLIRDDAVDIKVTEATRANAKNVTTNEPFDFGPDRAAWDAVFDDQFMFELNRRLYALPKSRRHVIRRQFFEAVVPSLANGSVPLSQALR